MFYRRVMNSKQFTFTGDGQYLQLCFMSSRQLTRQSTQDGHLHLHFDFALSLYSVLEP